MRTDFPLRIGLLDDDFFALKWNAAMIARDLRTTLVFEAETPAELLRELRHGALVDVVLVDVEYNLPGLELPGLIQAIQNSASRPDVICLSQYGGQAALAAAISAGARGFLLKNEVRLEICSAVVQALKVKFLVTPGVLAGMFTQGQEMTRIQPWLPQPGLSPQLRQVFTLKVLYGLSAPQVGQEIHLAAGTVEKYMQYVYQRLDPAWGDHSCLAGLELQAYPPEIQAFHHYTLPPREEG